MIIGTGIDVVEVARCLEWANKPSNYLQRIFSVQEIDYCFATPRLTAQRLAARFAAREAFFKALASAQIACKVPFLRMCRLVEVVGADRQLPVLKVDWQNIAAFDSTNEPKVIISLTHIPLVALASVILVRP